MPLRCSLRSCLSLLLTSLMAGGRAKAAIATASGVYGVLEGRGPPSRAIEEAHAASASTALW
eukprot:15481693-Alexandrium_andersonii.AAC.1